MKLYGTAWLIYGFKIDETDESRVDEALGESNKASPDHPISFVRAGYFEEKDIYLTAITHRAKAGGEAEPLGMGTLWVTGAKDAALFNAAMTLGVLEVPEPAWLLVADLDN